MPAVGTSQPGAANRRVPVAGAGVAAGAAGWPRGSDPFQQPLATVVGT